MFGTRQRAATWRRIGVAVLLGTLAAWLFAAVPVSAQAPPPGATVFMHSALC
jgi:hypothetical protein